MTQQTSISVERVTVPMPADMAAWLRERAAAEDRSLASLVRRCVDVARAEGHGGRKAKLHDRGE